MDDSSIEKHSGDGITVIFPDQITLNSAIRFKFRVYNNEAKYETFLVGLKLLKSLGVEKIIIFNDSQLVVNQVMAEYQAKREKCLLVSKALSLHSGISSAIPSNRYPKPLTTTLMP